MRLRALADMYRRKIEKDAGVASEAEIREYYLAHLADFEEVKLRRMLLPKDNFAIADRKESEKKALDVITEFRERAAAGGDFDQLQKEAFTAAGFKSTPPTTDAGNRRRADLSSDVTGDIFSLKPGEVSRVEKETFSFVVYKVEARRTLSLERVKDEISRTITKRKIEIAIKSVTADITTDLNEDYFGPSSANR